MVKYVFVLLFLCVGRCTVSSRCAEGRVLSATELVSVGRNFDLINSNLMLILLFTLSFRGNERFKFVGVGRLDEVSGLALCSPWFKFMSLSSRVFYCDVLKYFVTWAKS